MATLLQDDQHSFRVGETRRVCVSGSNRQMGEQLGEACRPGIAEALALVHGEMEKIGPITHFRARAQAYVSAIEKVAPYLVEEIRGLARGAAVPFEDALLLQLRFEAVGFDGRGGDGCSSFAIKRADGHVFTGQNVDTVEEHCRLGTVVEMRPDDGPDMLFYAYYPGMIGYLGINSEGLSVFGNALLSDGWRVGFPRYLSCRLALEQKTAAKAEETIRGLERASTINLLFTDPSGDIRNLEQTVDEVETLTAEDGRLFHTNHYVCERFRGDERLLDILPDSTVRRAQGAARLEEIDVGEDDLFEQVKSVLKDHQNHPSSICRHRAETSRYDSDQWMTVASLVADPAAGRVDVAFGPPCETDYQTFYLP